MYFRKLAVWVGADVFVREAMLFLLGHGPVVDLKYNNFGDMLSAAKLPQCALSNSNMRLRVSCRGWKGDEDKQLRSRDSAWDNGLRTNMILRTLKGDSVRSGFLDFVRSSIPHYTNALRVRVRLTDHILYKWLWGRRDLQEYLPLLVESSYLGFQCFAAIASLLCRTENPAYLVEFINLKIYSGCVVCVLERLSLYKQYCREFSTHCGDKHVAAKVFGQQYMDCTLGRFDHPAFLDSEDYESRIGSGQPKVINAVSCHSARFTELYNMRIKAHGAAFAHCVLNGAPADTTHLRPENTVLTSVASGSISGEYVNDLARSEIDQNDFNKKIAFAYMTEKEAFSRFTDPAELHSRSTVGQKTEPKSMRNVVPGTVPLYYWSSHLSAFGEKAFLSRLKNVTMMSSAGVQDAAVQRLATMAEESFTACRDYKNWNVAHLHTEFFDFYGSMSEVFKAYERPDLLIASESILTCLKDVGVYGPDGTFFKWEYGLQTGWRHTMLINTVFNVAAGEAMDLLLLELGLPPRLAALHQGDDSAELYLCMYDGPFVQAVLDGAGKLGKAAKQHFAPKLGSWIEFLRLYYDGRGVYGSVSRAVSYSISVDTQHDDVRSSPEQAMSCLETENTIYRRSGLVGSLRKGDLLFYLEYWLTPSEQLKKDERLPLDYLFASISRGGRGARLLQFPDLQGTGLYSGEVLFVRQPRETPGMESRARSKLVHLSPLDLSAFGKEYAQTVLKSTIAMHTCVTVVEPSTESLLSTKVRRSDRKPSDDTMNEAKYIASRVLANLAFIPISDYEAEDKNVDVAVGVLFAGSREIADAYIRKNGIPSYSVRLDKKGMVKKGLDRLACKTAAVQRPEPATFPGPNEYRQLFERMAFQHKAGREVRQQAAVSLTSQMKLVGRYI